MQHVEELFLGDGREVLRAGVGLALPLAAGSRLQVGGEHVALETLMGALVSVNLDNNRLVFKTSKLTQLTITTPRPPGDSTRIFNQPYLFHIGVAVVCIQLIYTLLDWELV